MLTNNPFNDILAFISPEVMQGYVVLMILLVIGGTVFDMMHKQSAKYFFEASRQAQQDAKHEISSGDKGRLALKTVANEVLTSSEFCNKQRRYSHLMTMYGFIFFAVTTALLIFKYTGLGLEAPALVAVLWHIGAWSLCVGGYWFWFSIRVDVASEGVKWHQLNGRGDLFILGLLSTATFATLVIYRIDVSLRIVYCKFYLLVWKRVLVQVCTHVFQAGGSLPKEGGSGRWFKRGLAC